jgi:ribonuclease Z
MNISCMTELNALWKVWDDHDTIKIPGTQLTLKGFSIAALRTNFYIPELSIMLDAGISGNMAPDYIFVTHSHSDHIANLPYHLYSAKNGKKIQIYIPEEMTKKMTGMLDSITMLNDEYPNPEFENKENGNMKCYNIVPVKPGISDVILRNKKYELEVIKCYHSVPCVGYGFSEFKTKLKDEYKELSSKEIGELRRKGVDVSCEVKNPILCFLGDTSDEVLKDKSLEKYRNIMIECTFIRDEELVQAEKTKHIHWKSLEKYITDHPNINFILYHFSQRYKKSEIKEFFDNKKLPNVIPWIN